MKNVLEMRDRAAVMGIELTPKEMSELMNKLYAIKANMSLDKFDYIKNLDIEGKRLLRHELAGMGIELTLKEVEDVVEVLSNIYKNL